MRTTIRVPLDLPDVEVLSIEPSGGNGLLIKVESMLKTTRCRSCGQEIGRFHGHDRAIRLRHLPIFDQRVEIELRPKRYQCPHCEGGPTTTQRCQWYEPNSAHTQAFERWVMKQLINTTVLDASRQAGLGYAAIEGIVRRWVSTAVDWSEYGCLETLGIDEIALRKGHRDFVTVVSHRDARGQVSVLAVLPNRLKATVTAFLASIPLELKATLKRVCSDMYEGYTEAVREALPGVELVIDRFHVAKHYREGVDRLRKQTFKRLKETLSEQEYEPLKGLMWVFRKHWAQLNEEQQYQLAYLFNHYAPELGQAYWLRQLLTAIFETSSSRTQGLERIDRWRQLVLDSGLSCFDAFLTTLDNWREDIANYFNDRHSSGFVEGLNNRLKVIKRRCYGLLDPQRLFQRIQIDLEGERLFA